MKNLMILATVALPLVSCSGGGGSAGAAPQVGTGSLQLLATDDPFPHALVTEAVIHVETIRIRDANGFTVLYDGAPIELDLLHLRNGITRQLVHENLPAGDYDQLRLVIESASLKLVNGDEFSTALGNLNPTSTGTAGLKLDFDPPLTVLDGVARSVLLDFDLTKTFHAVPANDPLSANSYQLHPKIDVSILSETGEARGTVREDDGTGQLVGVADATVYLLAPGETDLQNALRTSATEPDGSYALIGVHPGSYDLVAELDLRQDRSDDHAVAIGSVTQVDFVLP